MTGAAAMPPLIVIGGATATGKTELAIELAEAIGAEGRPAAVISADSRQVFRGLDIGTAKVSASDQARVPHFGLDLVDPDHAFSVADFVAHATEVLRDLARRDGVAILAGGTGLYLRAVARGLDTAALNALNQEILWRLQESGIALPSHTVLDGRFAIRGIAPGEYKLFAWDDIEPGAWQDPDLIKQVEGQGKSVSMREGAKESVQVGLVGNRASAQ